MIKRVQVEFTKALTLPRRSVNSGEAWEAMPHKFTKDGLLVAGGFAPNDSFKVTGFVYTTNNKKHL